MKICKKFVGPLKSFVKLLITYIDLHRRDQVELGDHIIKWFWDTRLFLRGNGVYINPGDKFYKKKFNYTEDPVHQVVI